MSRKRRKQQRNVKLAIQQEFNQRRSLAKIELARRTGALDYVGRYFSGQYILMSIAQVISDDISYIMSDAGIAASRIVAKQNEITKLFEEYFKENKKYTDSADAMNYHDDLETALSFFLTFTGIDRYWRPDPNEAASIKPEIEKQFKVQFDLDKLYLNNDTAENKTNATLRLNHHLAVTRITVRDFKNGPGIDRFRLRWRYRGEEFESTVRGVHLDADRAEWANTSIISDTADDLYLSFMALINSRPVWTMITKFLRELSHQDLTQLEQTTIKETA